MRVFYPRPAQILNRILSGRPATLWRASLILWVALLIATPICLWLAGDELFPLMATLGVLAQAGATLCALAGGWPLRRLLGAAAVVVAGTWALEALGSASGFPFGAYRYTPALQPQLAGVPLVIPLAWFMMLAPAWAIAEVILAGGRRRLGAWYLPLHAALSGAVFTAWDLYLDPQMVARGLWAWENPGGYYGIPWTNFLGWWLSAALLTLMVRPAHLPRGRLMLIYAFTWALQAIGLGLFWGQPGPALAGFAGMGVFLIWAWWNERPSGDFRAGHFPPLGGQGGMSPGQSAQIRKDPSARLPADASKLCTS